MIERVSTGITGLDSVLSGGVPKNTITTISGPIGAGKTCMAWQFIKQGLYADEKALLMTAKDYPERLLLTASEMGYDLEWAMEQSRLFVVDWRSILFEGTLVADVVKTFFARMLKLISDHHIKRLVFDPLLPMGLSSSSAWQSFFHAIQDQIGEHCPELTVWILLMEPFPETMAGALPFDSWISLGWKESSPRYRTLRIQKMPYTTIPSYDLTFDIIKGEGIVVLP